MRKLTSALAAVALVGLGLSAGGATAAPQHHPKGHHAKAHHAKGHHHGTPAYTPPPIQWGDCPTASLRNAGATCGMLTVPLDYARPGGQKIQLAVSKIAHKTSDAAAQGPMLVNPGGPGGSGLGLARLGAAVPNGGGDPYDWIGFDPRGVGRSVPSLSCDPDYFAPGRPAYVPDHRGVREYWWAKSTSYADDCAAAGGALLRHTHTTDWVRDMDTIRKALGASKINFYGFSYGTYLAQVYATTYPERVRRFVLDGVVNPTDVWYDANLEQEKQFDKNIDTFFDWIADNDAAYGLGTDGEAVRDVYYDTLDQLTAHPEPDFGAADWNDVFVGAAYYVYDWDSVAHVLVAAADGDLGPAKDYYGDPTGAGSDNTYANYLAVQCSDAPWPSKWKTWERDAWRIDSYAPFLAWNNTWYNTPCLDWAAPSARPVDVTGKHAPSMLLISETEDAATPYAGALEVRKRFPRSVLIEGVGGTTHAGSLSGVACTDDRIADYLLTGALPDRVRGNRSDVQCEPVPPPDATAPAAAARRSVTGQDRLGTLRDLITDAQLKR
ncbi:alpha/beta hydrolase [Nocardioides hankookensis]|uniref:Alpha/beta hydrolase n=1 Tax=Nocardioides hankookensis TaxID=443157 RepID=A0ABW1LSF6_9ACTN